MKKIIALLLLAVMLLCAGCGEDAPASTKPHESTNPTTATNPPAPTEPVAQGGAATQQELVKYVKEFYENDLNLEILQPVMDEDASIVYELTYIISFFSSDMELSEALNVVKAMRQGESALEEAAPRMYGILKDAVDLDDTQYELEDFCKEISRAIQDGELTAEDPNYEHLSQLRYDLDKGLPYIYENYPDIVEQFHDRELFFSAQDLIDYLLSHRMMLGSLERYGTDLAKAEYQFDVDRTYPMFMGFYTVDIATWEDMELNMVYYFRDGRYFLVGLFVSVFVYVG